MGKERMTLAPLTPDEIKSLSIDALVQRMDDVRATAQHERLGSDDWVARLPFPRVADLMSAQLVVAMDEPKRRRLADAAFRFLLQMDMLSVSHGITNAVVYGPNYNESLWSSPSHWMKAAVLYQYAIVASRIALECFFDLLYIADRGDRMSGGRSKFATFRKWVAGKDNPYKYFVGHIIHAFEFNHEHRQREVHGTSRFAHSLLRLQIPDSKERSISYQLSNVLLSVWQPLVQILNGSRPNSIAVFDTSDDFATKYLHFEGRNDEDTFDEFVADLLADRMT